MFKVFLLQKNLLLSLIMWLTTLKWNTKTFVTKKHNHITYMHDGDGLTVGLDDLRGPFQP